ncbi:substrate-binding domain-containing protein [Clostridium sp. DL1XJH146]
MKKKLIILSMVTLMMTSLVGCGGTNTNSENTVNDSDSEAYEIAVIVKATDSDYWQTLLAGAEAAAADSNGKIVVTTDGPPSEADIDKQVSILENIVIKQPDGIVIASSSTDATVPAIEDAMSQNIPVITVDNQLNTDNYTAFLATDHALAAGQAAEAMLEEWKENGIDPSGKKVVVVSSVAGTKVNTDRTEGFINKIKELVPDIEVLETQYGNNDITEALSITENLISANPELIGIFADNNHMGVGVAKALEENGKADEVIAYAFDADTDEISALEAGTLKGLVVQDPYGMGYNGVMKAVEAIEGNEVEKNIIIDATIVTKDNMNDEDIYKLLHPGE